MQLEWAFFLMQIVAMGLTKLSFVFFFRRIFLGNSRKGPFGITSMVTIVIISIWCSAFFFWFLLSCATNFTARWDTVAELHAFCPSDIKSDLALAISDVATDLLVILLPVPMVLKLRMPPKRKLLILAVFALGAIAVAASLVRLAFMVNITELAAGIISDPGADNNLLTTRALYWSMLESGLALIACCLPTLYALSRATRLQSLIKSARSYASLGSQHRNSVRNREKRSAASTTGELATVSSAASNHAFSNAGSIESHAMANTSNVSHDLQDTPEGEIWVDRTIELQGRAV